MVRVAPEHFQQAQNLSEPWVPHPHSWGCAACRREERDPRIFQFLAVFLDVQGHQLEIVL